MTVAILKLSYNNVGETPLTGGICGAAFFVNNFTALTAHHGFNAQDFRPNPGFKYCQYWLLTRSGKAIPFTDSQLEPHPEVDTTAIRFSRPLSDIEILNLNTFTPSVGSNIYNEGFRNSAMPSPIDAKWLVDSLYIESCDISNVVANGYGTIKQAGNATVNSMDVKLNNILCFVTSYPGMVGMSGGPMRLAATKEVIGLMSYGIPANAEVKTAVVAVATSEISKVIGFSVIR